MNPRIVELKIRALRIQGAENIAKEAVKSLKYVATHAKAKNVKHLINQLRGTKNELMKTRVTEPCMFNALSFVLDDLSRESTEKIRKQVIFNADKAIKHFEYSNIKVAETGANLIKKDSIIFTHCHSSNVVNVLKEAKRQRKRFKVYNTETRPRFQGRTTAKELTRAGIKVKHFIDSAARLAIKEADAMFIGCDAISAKGYIINKIGSEMFAETARIYGVPVYIFTDSWKFDKRSVHGYVKIEERKPSEIWRNPPKDVEIFNPAFERVRFDLVKAVICEKGKFSPKQFVKRMLSSSFPAF